MGYPMTPSPEDIDQEKTDTEGAIIDVPSPAPAEQSDQADDESDESFPDEPQAPGSQSPAGESAEVADESDTIPASNPPGSY